MKISIKELREIIRSVILEAAGGITLPHIPMVRNAMGPDFADREQLGRVSIKDVDEEEISPHLIDPVHSEEECWGPVPPTDNDPYAIADPYTRDYHVIPTPPIKR
jgi:hypothetical protein